MADAKGEQIIIVVKNQEGETTSFRVRTRTQFKKIFKAYIDKKGGGNNLRFMYDGTKIQDDQTPEDVGIEDGSQIDVEVDQQGGSGRETRENATFALNSTSS